MVFGILGEAAALAGTREEREFAREALRPFADRHLHSGPIAQTYEGPFRRVVGLLEASLGRLDEADADLEAARQQCLTHRLGPWVARLSLERASVALAAGKTSEATALFDEAAARAAELGMKRVLASARAALGRGPSIPSPPVTVAPPTAPAPLALEREGEVWQITWGRHVARVRDSRGVHLLAKLASSPGERIHALVLAGDGGGTLPESDAGEAIDRKAALAYRARLRASDEEIEDAKSRGDAVRRAKLERERDVLSAEIARGVGLGGRLRKVGSATERARINVTRRLKDVLARISEASPELGRHLEAEVQTGTYCSYGRTL
jgi:hypothetical protein